MNLIRDTVFSIQDRNRLRDRVIDWARSDSRVVAGAVIGSLAWTEGDRWSDLDLTFGVSDDVPVGDVLEEWTRRIVAEFAATQLFDLPVGTSIYRVFLVPDLLQFDLSFTPASDFGATGPNFRLLFGHAVDKTHVGPPSVPLFFGYAGLASSYGRGFDDLPADVWALFGRSLAALFDRAELLRALEGVVEGLLVQARGLPGLTNAVERQLRSLVSASAFES